LRSPVVETSFDVRTYLLAHEWVILHCADREGTAPRLAAEYQPGDSNVAWSETLDGAA